jgi:pimeloyl-ACP methyl ester carboxylesterase
MSSGIYDQAGGSPLKIMLKVFLPEALFPTKKNIIRLLRKMSGANAAVFTEDALLMTHYRWLLKGFNTMAMGFHKIAPFSPGQIRTITDKALFICGGRDPLGDRERAVATFTKYGARYEIIEDAGHGINHEHAQDVNRMMLEYFAD